MINVDIKYLQLLFKPLLHTDPASDLYCNILQKQTWLVCLNRVPSLKFILFEAAGAKEIRYSHMFA